MATSPERLTGREVRALEMLRDGHRVAESSTPGKFIVGSQSGKGLYHVEGVGIPGAFESCSCPDFEERNAPCKHIWAARHWIRNPDTLVRPAGFPSKALPSARAPINWHNYDLAQNEEYRLFNVLLRDLAWGFGEPAKDPHLAGRKPIPLREQVFCAVQKAYLGFSCRRSHGFRAEAARNGLLTKPPYWAVTSRFLCRDDVTVGLHDMLARSAIPLIGLEEQCAIDSTGLRTTRFNYYRKEKYDTERENDWRKLHALVGVKTHVMPVLEFTDGSVHDSNMFETLLRRALDNGFHFKEVLADKGYQGRANFNAAAKLEVQPFIPFKKNQTGETKGSPMYHKMFLFFQLHRERFDQIYGQRAQVESSFSAYKQKFGEVIASRNFNAQQNEVLCTAIAYNITILVRQMFESGILPDFLQPASPERASPTGRKVESAPWPSLNRLEVPPVVTQSPDPG
jgi:transposase